MCWIYYRCVRSASRLLFLKLNETFCASFSAPCAGLFTSPHLVTMRERIRLNGKPIDEERFLLHFWHVWDAVQAAVVRGPLLRWPSGNSCSARRLGRLIPLISQAGDEDVHQPGFFHFLTLLSFHIFAQEAVDVVVLEVGLGGRLDATNVISQPAVTGITTLDYDHVKVLGPTLPHIAREKAGIMKPGVPCFTVPQAGGPDGAVHAALAEAAAKTEAPLTTVDPSWLETRLTASEGAPGVDVPQSIAGGASYQRLNAALALALVECYLQRGPPPGWRKEPGVPPAPPTVSPATRADLVPPTAPMTPACATGLGRARWPGRAHALRAASSPDCVLTLCLDGAHTAAAMEKALEWFHDKAGQAGPHSLLFNSAHEKDPIPLLAPLAKHEWGGGVCFAPFDFGKPSRVPPPTAEQVFEAHFGHRVECGELAPEAAPAAAAHAKAVLAQVQGAALTPEAALSSGAASSVPLADAALAAAKGEAAPTTHQWQLTLAQVWGAIRAGALELGGSIPTSTYAEDSGATVAASVADALRTLGGGSDVPTLQGATEADAGSSPPKERSVLVTGSLYLVGNTLQHVGWDPDNA